MTDTRLVLEAFGKVILNFLPVVIFGMVGLAYISVDDRRSNYAKTKRKIETSSAKF